MRILAMLLVILASSALRAEPARYAIDPEHFSIAFLIEHVGYARMIGQFTQATGEFVYDEAARRLASGSIEVRAASVSTHHDERDAHLRSADFLAVDEHPLIRFVAEEYRASGDSGGTLRGKLTMLGQTHPVDVQVRLNKAAAYPFGHRRHTLGVSATATILRSQWGMTYGVADGMVGDAVDLIFEFEAIRERI